MARHKLVPWTVRYAPLLPSEMSAQKAPLEALRAFLRSHKPGQVALLHGMQGTGKTTMVHALARELEYELLEVNASDVRNESAIMETVAPALKNRSLFSQGKLILFDEVDGLSGTKDRGGLSTVLSLVKETPFPVVMTANDPWDSKFNDLRKKAVMIPVNGVPYTSIVPVLRRIAEAEKLDVEDGALQALARRAGGDMRAAITDLHSLGSLVSLSAVNTIDPRDVTGSITDAVRVVLKTRDPVTARQVLDTLDEDADEIFLWMDENLPREYRKPEDLARAYDALSRADVFRGRIRRWQHWRFLVYIYDYLGPGIALAKTERYEGFMSVQRTQRLLAMWKTKSATRDAIMEKLATEQHISRKQARREFRVLRSVLKDAPFLEEEEQAWISARKY